MSPTMDEMWRAHDEVPKLEAEVERLRAESEAFRGKLAEQCGQTLVARAEVERLGDLCDLCAEFIAERGLWAEYSKWCAKPCPESRKN